MSNGKNHNKTITFLYIICVVFSLLNWYNISKKTKVFLLSGYEPIKIVLIEVTEPVKILY